VEELVSGIRVDSDGSGHEGQLLARKVASLGGGSNLRL
jgi:hypothetical protein